MNDKEGRGLQPRVYVLDEAAWRVLRPELARNVAGASLLPEGVGGGLKIVVTRVAAAGEFATHVDPYGHLFYCMAGVGEGWLGEERYSLFPGCVVQVPAGLAHGYRNTGAEELWLLTVNLPREVAVPPPPAGGTPR